MKNVLYTLITLLLIVNVSMAQNVGINATGAAPNASAGLDVDFTNRGFLPPRVSLTSPTDAATIPSPATGLVVYNTSTSGGLTPGLYFNRGTPASPYWATFSKELIYHSRSTSGVTINTNGVVTLIPGTPITVFVPTGLTADIYIYAYGGAMLTGGTSTSWAVADLIIYKNGTFIPFGGWNRVKLNNGDGTSTDMANFAFVCADLGVTAGTYTYELRGNRFNGNQGVSIGADCATQVNCAEMTIVVKFR
jgi:hypothetical protein